MKSVTDKANQERRNKLLLLTKKISSTDITQHRGINVSLVISLVHPTGVCKYVIKVADIRTVPRFV
jgi:hypothetical protein